MMIDTHCHLYLDDFDTDRPAMMERAIAADVQSFYLPAIDSSVIEAMLQMETDYPGRCLAMMGVHPCSVKADYENELRIAEEWLERRPFAAIGETGLDFYWDMSFVQQQYNAFRIQAGWAKKYKIPLVIHSRQSTQACIDVVKSEQDGQLTGIFHCFGGSLDEARQIIELGFYLGIGGVITYKNSGLAAVVAELPIESLVLETDAPYLTPVPFRGKRNESSYLSFVLEKIAQSKNMAIEAVAAASTQNATRVFANIPQISADTRIK